MKITIDGNGSSIKGNKDFDTFIQAVEGFAAELPEGTQVIITDFEFHLNWVEDDNS